MSNNCKALVVTCIDFRFQERIFEFLGEQGLTGQYDLYSAAGTQKTFLDKETQAIALRQIELSEKFHGISEVYLIAHWDCGGYGGSEEFATDEEEKNKYIDDLIKVKNLINERFSKLTVKAYLATLSDGGEVSIEPV